MKTKEEQSSAELISSLGKINYGERITNLRNKIADTDINFFMITNLINIRYLTGFTGSNALVLLSQDHLYFITDGRYAIASKLELSANDIDAEILITNQDKNLFAVLTELFTSGQKIAIESIHMSVASFEQYKSKFSEIEFILFSNIVEELRKVKQESEVDRIRIACRIADEALRQCVGELKNFPTEKEFGKLLDRTMIDMGASNVSFETIVACGENGARPHASVSDKQIEAHKLIVIDFGCIYDGYCSDMTRTFSVGEPDAKQMKMYEEVSEAQRRGVLGAKANMLAKDVDALCRDYLEEKSMDETFTHGTGHGVGIEVHEDPRVAKTSEETIKEGYIITIEPGVYYEGFAGVRIEDTLWINGSSNEVLTQFDKYLLVE